MRAVRAGRSRSCIEGAPIHERFSRSFSFVYRRRRSTRTTLVGWVVRVPGVFGRNGPGLALRERFLPLESFVYRERGNTRTTFVQFFVRVLGEARYANDLQARTSPGAKCKALRRVCSGAGTRGNVRFPIPGQISRPFGHETAVLYDSAGPCGAFPQGRSALRPLRGLEGRKTPGQGFACISPQGRGSKRLSCPEEHRRTEPRFGSRNGRRI